MLVLAPREASKCGGERLPVARRPEPRRWGASLAGCALFATVGVLGGGVSRACVGDNCMQIWSTADGGGALTVEWDFENRKLPLAQTFCAASECLFSSIDPGFIAQAEAVPGSGYYPLADGTEVVIHLVSLDPGVTIQLNGHKLAAAGDSATLGTMPTIHSHPSWQLKVPPDEVGDYRVSYQLTTDSAAYDDSPVYTAILTNIAPEVSPTPTPAPTPTATPCDDGCGCPGDCDEDGLVAINEMVLAVNIALGNAGVSACPAADSNDDGEITVNELIAAVGDALSGCPGPPRATFEEIQSTIFTPTCATSSCHDPQSHTGNLVLSEGSAHDNLVGVPPDTFGARANGFLRVDPGHPENSFLLVKLLGPPPGEGSRMPLVGDPLDAGQIDLIRNWILQGAQP
jgi:hypothetical protein